MKTIIKKISPESFIAEELEPACDILRQGGLVAFPTETVYGLGADALREEASAKIYAAKGRPSDNPLIVHIAEMDALEKLVVRVPEQAERLAEQFWPGPLTMIFAKRSCVPYSTTGGMDTVAIRMPKHPVAAALIRQSGVAVAAPSANISGRPSPTRAEHVLEDLDGRIDMVLDGGSAGIGIESTIVDWSSGEPIILRPGAITREMMEALIGSVQVDPVVQAKVAPTHIVARAPGMKYRHYAPKGAMTILEGTPQRVAERINELAGQREKEGHPTAIITTEEHRQYYHVGKVCCIGSYQEQGSIASGLYHILRQMDRLGVEYIYAESFQEDALGAAIMNRMLKAAAYDIQSV